MPISWKGTLQQYAGCLHRLYDSKKEVRIYDYVDDQVPMLQRMYTKRKTGYRAMGYLVTDLNNNCSNILTGLKQLEHYVSTIINTLLKYTTPKKSNLPQPSFYQRKRLSVNWNCSKGKPILLYGICH